MAEVWANAAKGGRRMTALGVIAIVLGVLAMLAPLAAGMSIVFLLGALVAIVGALRMVWAFRAGSLGRGVWVFVIGTSAWLVVLGAVHIGLDARRKTVLDTVMAR